MSLNVTTELTSTGWWQRAQTSEETMSELGYWEEATKRSEVHFSQESFMSGIFTTRGIGAGLN